MSRTQDHPARGGVCGEGGCDRADTELIARFDRPLVALCPEHAKEHLGVSS